MKRFTYLILAISLVMLFSSSVYADDFEVIGREIFPGINLGERTVGALFVGKFFDSSSANERGRFTLTLDHNGEGVEACGGETRLIRFKLIMNFNTGARLVLLGPTDGPVNAYWDWNDPTCENGNCPLIDGADYIHYIALFGPLAPNPVPCAGADAFIAEVPVFDIARQRFGSYGTGFSGGSVSGHLVHTPILSPAIFGSLALNE